MNYYRFFGVFFFLAIASLQAGDYAYEGGLVLDDMTMEEDELLFDFDKGMQDFVLETKKIEIPGYPKAFNPSLVRWKDSLLLSFRFRTETGRTHHIGFVWLDDAFNVVSEPKLLKADFEDLFCASKRQDARLIVLKDRLYVVYNNMLTTVPSPEVRRMVVAEVHYDGENFSAQHSEVFLDFKDEHPNRCEKNWVPFVHNDSLYFAYTVNPHRILRPIFGENRCEEVSMTAGKISWDYGQLRGGTPAVLDGDEYISFFHSVINMESMQSKGRNVPHYVMGAYTFSKEKPFALTSISKEPLVGPGFYSGPSHRTWRPMRVVFPMGLVVDGPHLLVAYGVQDHEVWIVKFDKNKLKKSLIPVKTHAK